MGERRIPQPRDCLLQRRVERRELGVERAAETVHDGDDGQRDAGGDQAVFDGRGAALVLQKSAKQKRQYPLLVLKMDTGTAGSMRGNLRQSP